MKNSNINKVKIQVMKAKLIVVFLLSFNLLQAQSPIINRANYFTIGDSVLRYRYFNRNSASIGSSGPNALWNLSNMGPNVVPDIDTVFCINPVGTPFYPTALSADYSRSNLCLLTKTIPISPGNNNYQYYHQ